MAVPNWVPKDLKADFKRAEEQGWRFKKTKNGGQAIAPPPSAGIVTFHLTEGRHGARLTLSRMRKYGYDPNRD
jgi:hypothetical protein